MVSVAGGVMHIVGQTLVACIILETAAIAYMIPMLAVTAIISGALVGILGNLLIKKLKLI